MVSQGYGRLSRRRTGLGGLTTGDLDERRRCTRRTITTAVGLIESPDRYVEPVSDEFNYRVTTPHGSMVERVKRLTFRLRGDARGREQRNISVNVLERDIHGHKIEECWVERLTHPIEQTIVFLVLGVGEHLQ